MDPVSQGETVSPKSPAPELKPPAGALNAWWRVARPFSLTAAVAPILVGGALAAYQGAFRPLLFFEVLVASLFIQAGTNMVNEHYDYAKGLDTPESLGIGGVIVRGELTARAVLLGGLTLFGLATLIGVHVGLLAGWEVFAAGLVCIAAAYLYTGGPWPVAYTPFGELEVSIFMGFAMVFIGYYVHTGTVTTTALLAAIPVSCVVAAILLANNVRDAVPDAARGRRTLAVTWGRKAAVRLYFVLLVTAYAVPVAAVALGRLEWPALLPLATMGLAARAVLVLARGKEPSELAPVVPLTANLHGLFGVLLAAGIALGLVV